MVLNNFPLHPLGGLAQMEKKNKVTQVLLHVLACLAFLCLPILTAPPDLDNVFSDWQTYREIFTFALIIIFFYVNYYYLIPRFYFNKKYVVFTLSVLVCFIVVTTLPNLINISRNQHPEHFPTRGGPFGGHPHIHGHHGIIHFLFVRGLHHLVEFMTIFFLSLMMKINTRYKAVSKEKITSELSYLKAQINPHFLFNTLNSIYSLAVKRSEKTPDAIVALSGMMRYVLNEANNDLVPLEKELDYIKSYIDLQTNRFGNTLDLSLNINGIEPGHEIAPLILISFIENAFKYGVNPEESSKISIEINLHGNELMFRITNNIVSVRTDEVEQTGIGLENTQARLQLLYPARHNIAITQHDNEYTVLLILKLK